MQRSFSLFARPTARLLARPTALPMAIPAAISQRLPQRLFSAAPEPLTVADIEGRVLKVLQDFAKVDSSKLSLDAHFSTTLGLDSLDQVEVVMALEDEFNIEIPDKAADEIQTVRAAVEAIHANKNSL